jgi:hypothetical protein
MLTDAMKFNLIEFVEPLFLTSTYSKSKTSNISFSKDILPYLLSKADLIVLLPYQYQELSNVFSIQLLEVPSHAPISLL